jgi:type VI secretion system protein ImpG
MDPRFRDYYERELRHLAEMCGEFAEEFPKIAGRLSLDGFIKEFKCPDPYVERLLEGFAYMSARVQLKVDAEYPRFTQHLLDMVYPDYLAPVPSMGIVRLQPDMTQGSLQDGIPVPRGSILRGRPGRESFTPCQYRTAHDVRLWPIKLVAARYLSSAGAVAALPVTARTRARAALRLRLAVLGDAHFGELALDRLVLYLRGGDEVAMRLFEQLIANSTQVAVQAGTEERARALPGRPAAIGFTDDEALLPAGPRTFQGYRLLKEYFAFPEHFMSVALTGLHPALAGTTAREIEILVLFDRSVPMLEEAVDASRFELFCTPVINLFPKRLDRIHLSDQTNEYHVVADRSRPLDYEIYQVTEVLGYGAGSQPEQTFLPFYACNDAERDRFHEAYYALWREPRRLSQRQQAQGARSSYVGSEVFLSLVDAAEAPFSTELRQLGLQALCTNRDLSLQMPVGTGTTDLSLEIGVPVESVRFLAGPTEPRAASAHRDIAWKLISHLSLNYLSLADPPGAGALRQGDEDIPKANGHGRHHRAAALRELLELYAATGNPLLRTQVEGVLAAEALPVDRRLPDRKHVSIGRGLEIRLMLDEAAFTGSGPFLLAAVLEQFFARYVSLNSFTETLLTTPARGEVMRWPARIGQRTLL